MRRKRHSLCTRFHSSEQIFSSASSSYVQSHPTHSRSSSQHYLHKLSGGPVADKVSSERSCARLVLVAAGSFSLLAASPKMKEKKKIGKKKAAFFPSRQRAASTSHRTTAPRNNTDALDNCDNLIIRVVPPLFSRHNDLSPSRTSTPLRN